MRTLKLLRALWLPLVLQGAVLGVFALSIIGNITNTIHHLEENLMAIVNTSAAPVVAPAVTLPATGVDPTAAAPALSAHDAALVAEVQATIAAKAAAPVVAAADPTDAVAVPTVAPAVEQAAQAAPAVTVAQPQPEVAAAAPAPASQAADASGNAAAAAPVTGSDGATAGDAAQAGAGASAPAQPELTPSQKIAAKIAAKQAQITKLTAEIEKLEQQFRSADLLDSVKQGSVIVARVGRAETAREVTASVVGVQTLENGDRRLKIYFGDGFDAETVVIQDSQIVDVKQV